MATEAATPPPPPAQAASGKGAPAAAPAEHKLESAWRLWYDKKLPRSESQKKTYVLPLAVVDTVVLVLL